MSVTDPTESFIRLGLPPDADTRSIKRAYARELKLIDTTTEPERFAQLRQDYEQALAHAASARESMDFAPPREEVPEPVAREAFDPPELQDPPRAEPVHPPADQDAGTTLDDDEPYIFEPESRPPEAPAPDELLEQLARAATFASDNVPAAIMVLRSIVETEALTSLTQRDAFEVLLVDALRTRRFGTCNGALLLAAAEVFGWRTDGARHLSRMGFSGSLINAVLDEISHTSEARLERMLALAGEPTPVRALKLWKPEQEINAHTPLGSVLYPPGHLERWAEAHAHAPLAERAKLGIRRFLHSSAMWRVAVVLLIVPVAIGIFSMVLSRVGQEQVREASMECQRAFASAKAANWKNVTLSATGTLQKCAAQVPPESCADREGLLTVAALANRLIPGMGDLDPSLTSYYQFMPYAAIRLNLDDGRSFGLLEGGTCEGVESFLDNANWLAEGDEKAARQLIEAAARCRDNSKPYQRRSPALYTFLEHTDAWPVTEGSTQKVRYRLRDLIGSLRPIDTAAVARALIKPQNPWAACRAN
jgi:hypothetical protein